MVRVPELPDLEPESTGDTCGTAIIIIDDSFGGCAWELLVPAQSITPNVGAASSAGVGDCLSQGPRHGGWLSQHRLGPGRCKGEKHRDGDGGV